MIWAVQYKYKMSASNSSRGQTILSIKQLHLSPHFVYMINETQYTADSQFTLVMEKDGVRIGQTSDISYIEPSEVIKYPALEFGKVRFVFNVKALFEDESAVKIHMKLLEGDQLNEPEIRQQFQINLLHYSYEHSRERVVKHKQNSIGRLRKYILNYSFSAIYGKAFDENTLLARMHQAAQKEQDKEIELKQQPQPEEEETGFKILVKEPLASKTANTLVLVEAVAEHGIANLALPGRGWEETVSDRSYFGSSQSRQTELVSKRKVPRSIMVFDNQKLESMHSSMTQPEQNVEDIKEQGSMLGGWALIFISIVLIYFLMHPTSRL